LITGVQAAAKVSPQKPSLENGVSNSLASMPVRSTTNSSAKAKETSQGLELAQKMAPVVLWIDEIEKAFASASSGGDSDAGLSQRLLATLLTWMQDRESGVFLAATSNNISALPPEMLRKGRFDEIFSSIFPAPPSVSRSLLCISKSVAVMRLPSLFRS